MKWGLTDDQELFRDGFRGWLERFAPRADVRDWYSGRDSTPFERRFHDDGWFVVGTAEEHGGSGGGLLELALAAEQLGRAAAPSAGWLASALAHPALSREIAEECLSDGTRLALVVNASAPIDAVLGAANPAGSMRVNDGALSGTVPMVLGAIGAHRLIVPANDGEQLRMYLVDAADAALAPRQLLDASRAVADVHLDAVKGTDLGVTATDELSRMSLRAAVLTAADSLGIAERVMELAVEYSKQRNQFGAPIGSFQAVKHAAATMLVTVESTRTLVYYAAAAVEQAHADFAAHAAAAKAQVCAGAAQVVDSALVIHGAIGYTWEHDLHLFYKRAKLNEHLFGNTAAWNERLARELPLLPVA